MPANPSRTGQDAPLYTRIHHELYQRILAGLYPLGSLLPPEVELAAEFDTSRATIREALRQLTDQGLVERRQGMGTRVLADRITSGYYQSYDSLQELFQVAVDTWMVILGQDEVVLDAPLALLVGAEAGQLWHRVYGIRWTAPGGRPLCFIESYIPAASAQFIPELNGLKGPFFAHLQERSGLTIREVEQEIRSLPMLPEAGRLMGLAEGSQALQLLRRYQTDQGVLITSVNWHPAEQMVYRMKIRRNQA